MKEPTFDVVHSVEGETWFLLTENGTMTRYPMTLDQLLYLNRCIAEAVHRAGSSIMQEGRKCSGSS